MPKRRTKRRTTRRNIIYGGAVTKDTILAKIQQGDVAIAKNYANTNRGLKIILRLVIAATEAKSALLNNISELRKLLETCKKEQTRATTELDSKETECTNKNKEHAQSLKDISDKLGELNLRGHDLDDAMKNLGKKTADLVFGEGDEADAYLNAIIEAGQTSVNKISTKPSSQSTKQQQQQKPISPIQPPTQSPTQRQRQQQRQPHTTQPPPSDEDKPSFNLNTTVAPGEYDFGGGTRSKKNRSRKRKRNRKRRKA
jgi:chromosome segregation ATPase